MSAPAAGGMLMWMSGVLIGLAATGKGSNFYVLMIAGTIVALFGVIYIRRFAESR